MLISLALDLFLILALYNYVPWLGLFIGVALFLIFILAKIIRLKAEWIWLPMAVFVFIMVLRMIGPVSIVRVNLPVEVSLNYQTSADIAAQSLKNKLLVGSGPATYGYDFSLYRPKDFNLNALYNLRFFQGSGIIAEAVPTVGIVGTFFLVVIVLSYIGSGLYLLYRDKEKNKLCSLGIFSAAAIFIVDILSLRPDGATLLLAALFATLALAASVAESGSQPNRFNLSLKASPKFALALAFVFMAISAGVAFLFVFLGKIYAADVLAKKSAENISQNPDAALNYLGRAINLNRWESNYYIQLGQYYMALVNDEVAKGENSRDINKIQEYLNYSIATTNQGKNMSKNNVASVETLALIYENAGFYVADSLNLAEENYKRALELEPHNPVYYIKLGRLKINMTAGKKEIEEKKALVNEAADLFRKAVDEKSNYAEGYYQLSLAEEALNQLDQAIENVSKAFQINPRNSEYLMTLGRLHQQRNKEGDKNLTEQYYKAALAIDDKNINGHFNLGLFYERDDRKNEAKNEYNKIIDLLKAGENNGDMIKQIQNMISNINQGIENTPENLGLVQPVSETEPSP